MNQLIRNHESHDLIAHTYVRVRDVWEFRHETILYQNRSRSSKMSDGELSDESYPLVSQ